MYDILENNYFEIINLFLLILNLIFSFALAGKLNSLNQNLYETFKFNGFLQNKPKKWNYENFYLEDLKENG